jgi:hypothetical protein
MTSSSKSTRETASVEKVGATAVRPAGSGSSPPSGASNRVDPPAEPARCEACSRYEKRSEYDAGEGQLAEEHHLLIAALRQRIAESRRLIRMVYKDPYVAATGRWQDEAKALLARARSEAKSTDTAGVGARTGSTPDAGKGAP